MAKITGIVYENELNRHHQEIVARRTALVEIERKQDELQEALEALPDDEVALTRNGWIKRFCSKALSTSKKTTETKNIQLHRHEKLIKAYEKMVKRELSAEKGKHTMHDALPKPTKSKAASHSPNLVSDEVQLQRPVIRIGSKLHTHPHPVIRIGRSAKLYDHPH